MTTDDGTRTRTFHWSDPSALAVAARGLSGLDALRAILRGELPPPPIADLVGMRLVSVEPSSAVFEFEPAEYMYNPLGAVHGGILTVLLDSAMGCAFHTTLPPGISYTTLELKVNFVRPVVLESGTIRAEAKVIHPGTTVGTAEGRLLDAHGTLFAHATCTMMILRSRPRTE
jgi:uncharacterized protein (TIGR00369 family)